jgi:integral membrane sensor domain MASE1
VYIVAAKLGLSLAYATAQITAVWPPSGIALVAIFILGYRYFPGVFLGALIANLLTHESAGVAIGISIGNTLEALAGVYILREWVEFKGRFTSPWTVLGFAAACIVSPIVAATIGTDSLALGGLIPSHHYWGNWVTYWAGDLMGALVIATALFVFLDKSTYKPLGERPVEGGFVLASLLAASTLAFTTQGPFSGIRFYLLLPFMIWAALRFTKLGVATSTLIVSTVAIWATVNNLGAVSQVAPDQSLISLLIFVLVLSETMLLLAISIEERVNAEAALLHKTQELEKLQAQLRDANRRVTGILENVLDEGRHEDIRRSNA